MPEREAELLLLLQRCHRIFQFDLRRMIVDGRDYNQAVKDVADAVERALSDAKE